MERTIRTHRVITEVDTTWGYETQVQAKKNQTKKTNKQYLSQILETNFKVKQKIPTKNIPQKTERQENVH